MNPKLTIRQLTINNVVSLRDIIIIIKNTLLLIGLLLIVNSSLAIALETPVFKEAYRIRIENNYGGEIAVSKDEGGVWEQVGSVLRPVEKVNEIGYAAARWIASGRVAASAVNAIHLKTGASDEARTIFSILPREFFVPPKKYRSYLDPQSSISTDIPAGKSIFGGGFAPFVGNIIMVSQPAGPVIPLPRDFIPQLGDVYYILVDQPAETPKEIVFENWANGDISISYFSEEDQIIGKVVQPVSGIGRFEGSRYVDPGRIRANHAGPIDVSVSPQGSIGGFQIVPAYHGSEMGYVAQMTQWMVVGPPDLDSPSLEGTAPLFKYFLQPSYVPHNLVDDDWEEELLSRFLVEVRFSGEAEWKPVPVFGINEFYVRRGLPSWAGSALKNVSYVRILFPVL